MIARTAVTAVAILLALARPASAQVQGYPVSYDEQPVQPVAATPPLTPAPTTPQTGRRTTLLPPIAANGNVSTSFKQPPGEPFNPVPDVGPSPLLQPRPCQPEPKPPCDDPFRCTTQKGGAYTFLPRTLLWEPPMAMPREPRFLVMPTTLSNGSTRDTIDTSIGSTIGLLRAQPADWKTVIQPDFFAVVTSRFSQYNYLVDTDYRFGFPVTFARGPWQWKVGYEHMSSHLGDEVQQQTGQQPFPYVKDEFVLGVGRFLFDERWRIYGEVAWAMHENIPGDPSPFRFDIGTEWVRRRQTGGTGQPFVATNTRFDGASGYSPDFSLQVGWIWRDGTRRFAEARVFGQYYTGYSPFGQYYLTRENWFGFGVAFDY